MRTAVPALGTAAVLAAALAAALLAGGCAAGPAASSGGAAIEAVVAFYPLQFVAERVGGDRVRVTNLVRPGVEPHDLELRPRQLATIADADVVVYLAGFQPAVDEGVAVTNSRNAFDVGAVEPLIGEDPHVWLDPTRLATIGDRLADRLAHRDGWNGDTYHARAAALRADLTALDTEFATGLRDCPRRDIVTSHDAFGYLAARYGLAQVPISGLSPESEPTPQRVAAVAALARDHGATTIFFETLVSPKVARTLATEVGARAEVLDPIEGLDPDAPPGSDYVSVMRENLAKLRTALGCI